MIFAVCFGVAAAALAYFYVEWCYEYWKRKGVDYLKPIFPIGNFWKVLTFNTSVTDLMSEFYKSSDKPFYGLYAFLHPALVVRDANLMRHVLVKDFSTFPNRGLHSDGEVDPLSANLVTLDDKKWKKLRGKFTPAFTLGKLKLMFPTFVSAGVNLENRLNELADDDDAFNMVELASSHTINIITSTIFGLEVDCIKDPNSDFRYFGREDPNETVIKGWRGLLWFTCPPLMTLFNARLFEQGVEDFFVKAMTENMEYREKNNIVRKDFFQLLIQLKNGIDITSDDRWTNDKGTVEDQKLSMDEIVAQAFTFYMAGYETSALTVSWCMYELSKHPELQRRAQTEVDEVLKRHDGQYTYESFTEMKYLEMCMDETLRLYPPLSVLTRRANKPYKIPDSDIVLDEGTDVMLLVGGAQRDPNYYPHPNRFDPERFSEASRADPDFARRPHFPFGDGPRNCIGVKLAKVQTITTLAMMLEKFTFELTNIPGNREKVCETNGLFSIPKDGIEFRVRRREKQT